MRYQSIGTATVFDQTRNIEELKKIIPPFLYNSYKNTELDYKTGVTESCTKFRAYKINVNLFIE